MAIRPLKTLTLLALATLSALAHADDPPARVGRVSMAQGPVSIASDVGAETAAAQVNWPVTTGNLVTTAAGARTELRIGSTSIRLDGDSSLEVLELDDDSLRLRLHYGSASVRVTNPDVLPGFVIETPQARVRLQQPGRVRVDAEQVRDTSAVTVFDGAALVDGGGSQLTVRAGRRAELGDEDVRTLAARRDAFDDWAAQRDRYQDSAASVRYVGTEMTGYEDLDRYGSWSVDNEYGPLWYPTVAATWVPYRDGSWCWVEPWGWTWVDNAPWGYAPFHYGRWMQVHHRWAWVPGRRHDHPVWAPALVGWVGGAGWSMTFNDRRTAPARGWYPLSPWEHFTPAYHAPDAQLRWWSSHEHTDRRPHDYRPQGLTVVPQDRFEHQGRVNVPRAPLANVPPTLVRNVPAAAPPVPASLAPLRERRNDVPGRSGRPGHLDTARADQDGFVRQRPQAPGLVQPAAPVQPQPIVSPAPHQSPQPVTVTSPAPQQLPQQIQQPQQQGWPGRDRDHDWRNDRDGRDGRDPGGEWRRNRQAQPVAQQPVQQAQPVPQAVQPVAPVPQMVAPQRAVPAQNAEPRFERPRHGGFERPREAEARPAMEVPRPQPQPQPQPQQAVMARPAPSPAPAPSAPHQAEGPRSHGEPHRDPRQQER